MTADPLPHPIRAAVRVRAKNGFLGVYRYGTRFEAALRVDGRKRRLGVYPDPITAAAVYDKAARQKHGSAARLNFPGVGERPVLALDDEHCARGHSLAEHGVERPYRIRPQCRICMKAAWDRSNLKRRKPR